MRRSRAIAWGLGVCASVALGAGCSAGGEPADSADTGQALSGTVEVYFLYVHGLQSCDSSRQNAGRSLQDLESAVNAALPAKISAYQASHPGVTVVTHSARANIYTATPSGVHPSDSTDPLHMDDWEVGDPGCTTTQQGDPCTTGYEWRYRLVQEIEAKIPASAKNIVLVGHSTGARAAMEVTANVGPNGAVGGHDWGVQDRIAGVVTVHGMLDSIGTSKYDVAGPLSFETTCKDSEAILGFGDSCAPGNGFCEYGGRVTSFPAADWVATNRRALMLTSWGSCSPSLFGGQTDGTLPYDAQASAQAIGLDMTPAPGQTFRHVDGVNYGSFCHSDITSGSSANHGAAVGNARDRILDWLFVAAPRVANQGSVSTSSSIAFNQTTAPFSMGSSCPAGDVDDGLTHGDVSAGIDVVGVCKHPGFFDGDDHAVATGELNVSNGATCNGSFTWTQKHDSSNKHAATFWYKTRSVHATAPELLGNLSAD